MAAPKKVEPVRLTTGIGIVSFVRVFPETADVKPDGTKDYSIQVLIPKTQRDDIREILTAIKKVGEAKWGASWKSVRRPLRDGDAEAYELTEDGTTKREKYPERLGHYFFNARSSRPVSVVDRDLTPIYNENELYSGCKGRVNIEFYAYARSGNNGIGVGLNGVQKIADGEPLGGAGKPSVESMFDLLDEDDLEDLADELDDLTEDEAPAKPAKKAAKKAPAKKAAKKAPAKKAEPEPEDIDLDEDDEFDDLDDDL